jgi:hypothetical protein
MSTDWSATMPTLQLNSSPDDKIQMDAQSGAWLSVCRRHSNNQRTCTMPKRYFDVLQGWGYVEGTFSAAKISPTGLARMIAEEQEAAAAAKEAKKQAKKKKH